MPKILLADDSITMHRAVALALKKENVDLICCDNGQDGLRLAIEHQPAIVLADLDMPGMTGIELCHALKQHPLLKNTKVVLLCGSFDQVDEGRLESVPADGRLWKPFETHVLSTLVQRMLQESAMGSANPTLAGTPRVTAEPTAFPSTPFAPPPPPNRGQAPRSILEETLNSSRDMAADMTQETFRSLHEPEVGEETGEIAPGNFRETPIKTLFPPPPPSSSSPTGASNLWEKTFRVPDEATAPLDSAGASPTMPLNIDLEEVSSEALPPAKAKKPKTREADLARLKELRALPSTIERSVAEKTAALPRTGAPAIDPETLRKMIREELDQALRGWFAKNLDDKLQAVLAEIDRD